MTETSKWKVVAALMLLWATLIVWRIVMTPEPQAVPLKYRSGQSRMSPGGAKANPEELLSLPVRAKLVHMPPAPTKNIFAPLDGEIEAPKPVVVKKEPPAPPPQPVMSPFPRGFPMPGAQPPPPPTPEQLAAMQAKRQQELAEQEARRRHELAEQDARRKEEQAKQQAQQELGQYRLFGYVSRDGESRALLSKGKEIFILRKGDLLEGKIRVSWKDETEVTLREPSKNLEATIPLSKSTANPS